jgi:hypothetical protein
MKAKQQRETTVDWRATWEAKKAACCDEAHRRMMREYGRFWLYYRPTTGVLWGEFIVCRDGEEPEPGTAELVTGECIPSNVDRAGLARWLNRLSGGLSMIPSNV